MDLRYSVIIDTEQAKASTKQLEKYFEELENSTNKDIKAVGKLGKELVSKMNKGEISTKQATKSFEDLRKEILNITVKTQKLGKENKESLRNAHAGILLLKKDIKNLEAERTKAHIKNIKQMERENAQQRKLGTGGRLFKYGAGKVIRNVGGGGSTIAGGLAKTGVWGAIIGLGLSAISAIKGGGNGDGESWGDKFNDFKDRFKKNYSEAYEFIDNAVTKVLEVWDWIYTKFLQIAQKLHLLKEFNGHENTAEGYKLDKQRDKDLQKTETTKKEARELLTKIHEEGNTPDELAKAFKKLREKTGDLFSSMSDTDILAGDVSKQMDMLENFYDQSIKKFLDTWAENRKKQLEKEKETITTDFLNNSKEYRANTEATERIKERQKPLMDLYKQQIQTGQEQEAEKTRAELDKLSDELKELQKQREDLKNKAVEEYNAIYNSVEAEKKLKLEEQERAKYITKRRKAEELAKEAEKARQQREKDIESLRQFQKLAYEGEPAYEKALKQVNELYKINSEELNKLKPKYGDTKEWQDAKSALEKWYKESTEAATEFIDVFFEKVENNYKNLTQTEFENTKNAIIKKYEDLRKELDNTMKRETNPDEYDRNKNIIDTAEAIELENAAIAEQIRLREEQHEQTLKDIENGAFDTNGIDEETAAIIEEIKVRKDKIEIIKKQKHVSETERQEIKNLRVEIDNLTNSMAKNSDVYLRAVTNSLSNSGNTYANVLGNSMEAVITALQNEKNTKMSKQEKGAAAVSAGVQFSIEAFEMIYNSVKRNKEALEQWNNAIEDSAHRLALMNIEEWEYKQKNVLGVENPYDKIAAALNKDRAAKEETAKAIAKLMTKGQVQTGIKNKYKADEMATIIGSGIAAGATIGMAAGSGANVGLGTAIGAAAGAITGTITGLIAAKEKVAVFDTLKNKYGYIFDDRTLEINKQILADYDLMDEKTKKLIDNARELLDVQKQTREEWEQQIVEMVGRLGEETEAILLDAFRNNRIYDAVDDLKGYLADTMTGILSKEIFTTVFGQATDKMKERLMNGILTYDEYGVAHITGDIPTELTQYANMISDNLVTYNLLVKQMKDKFKEWGYDIFGNEESGQEQLKGAISGMTEETANKINGNFFGLKLTTMEINDKVSNIKSIIGDVSEISKRSLDVLREIAENTSDCKRLKRFDELADDIREMKRDGVKVL